ncbi:MAG: glycoside hydrolase family 3 protein [Candidatus Cryptobacteroides sp.]|jgi:beta-N-acetylhexosaminidase
MIKAHSTVSPAVLVSAALILFCSSCGPGSRKLIPESRRDSLAVEKVLASMTLREKVGQMFIVRPEALDPSYSNAEVRDISSPGLLTIEEEVVEFDRKYPVGGVALYAKNIRNPEQLLKLTDAIHTRLLYDPLVCVDEEGGRVARLANNDSLNLRRFESMRAIAAKNRPKDAFRAARYIGTYLKKYGFDVTFAPVADVSTNPRDTVIGPRSFSSDPDVAAKFVVQYLKGLARARVAGCLKHYPGQGNASKDTHYNPDYIRKNWEELEDCELRTFRAGIAAGAPLIMSAHLVAIEIDTTLFNGMYIPVSLSKLMLDGKLRGVLGFKGLIISDGLDMKAIMARYQSRDSALMAIDAGTDLVLLPYDFRHAFEAVVSAVEKGEISEERIDRSVRKILLLKRGIRR